MATPLRPRRAFWGDVRFLIGIALVALSISGVWFIVSASDDATPVLLASRTITKGETLASGDFQVVEVGLGALTDDYLGPQDLQPGQVASRTVWKGEIVPVAVAAPADANRSTTIVVESTTGIPEDVEPGTVVELWHAPPLDDGRSYDAPRILVADVIVRTVLETDGVLADAGTQVEIVIDRADVADVLAAVTGGAALSVVPVRAEP
ncbi:MULTISPECIES: SAF domain-containing protein [unclassified Microbacterium]|uniref:SAF domain-containing protein n=1 Tax=unclassified Microbacterium TaxID=2609290 RepID=UPI000EAA83FC|nr:MULTISPECIES: SAF domain-containing protein [unclassified Microbacterium]MBT2485436.1 SAF domain-containing protein [Microbacterium sp. ISL-108]RKN68233.1 hypothetical protein D7252_12005 [Microbacterium sp. CGR2]